MLEFAEKLIKYPGDMNESDIEKLRSSGFNDEEILSISLVTNYFNFVNRNANALGVEFSEEEVKGYKY
jgi:alkylhydroperoxidase family enzyme